VDETSDACALTTEIDGTAGVRLGEVGKDAVANEVNQGLRRGHKLHNFIMFPKKNDCHNTDSAKMTSRANGPFKQLVPVWRAECQLGRSPFLPAPEASRSRQSKPNPATPDSILHEFWHFSELTYGWMQTSANESAILKLKRQLPGWCTHSVTMRAAVLVLGKRLRTDTPDCQRCTK